MRGWLLLAAVACGAPAPRPAAPVPAVPRRAETGAEPLLALLPPDADAVAELDLARLRDNPTAGSVLAVVPRREVLGFDPARDVDLAVAAVYRLGHEDAQTLIVLRGAGLAQVMVDDATRIDDHTIAIGPAPLRARAAAGPRVVLDAAFLALRAAAMPPGATGAALRITGRLGPAARIAAAGRLAVDELPASLSVWLDVEDDAALIAILGGDDPADGKRLVRGVEAARQRLGPWLPRAVLDSLQVELVGRNARLVWVVPPRRLEAWARELRKRIGGQS